MAFPIAQRFFTNGFTGRCWVGAFGVAGWFFTDGIAFWAGTFFTMFDGATYFTFWFVAFNGTFTAAQFLATGGASGLFTDGFTDLVTDGRRTFPLAFRMAIFAFTTFAGGVSTSDSFLHFVGQQGSRHASH